MRLGSNRQCTKNSDDVIVRVFIGQERMQVVNLGGQPVYWGRRRKKVIIFWGKNRVHRAPEAKILATPTWTVCHLLCV